MRRTLVLLLSLFTLVGCGHQTVQGRTMTVEKKISIETDCK